MTTSISISEFYKATINSFNKEVGKKKMSFNPTNFLKSRDLKVQENFLNKITAYQKAGDRSSLLLITKKIAYWINMHDFSVGLPTDEDIVVYENLNRFLYKLPLEYTAVFLSFCPGGYFESNNGHIISYERQGYQFCKNLKNIYRFETAYETFPAQRNKRYFKTGSLSYICKRVKYELWLV